MELVDNTDFFVRKHYCIPRLLKITMLLINKVGRSRCCNFNCLDFADY